jgi:2-(1,2-epoxy-1,2-dihydrophenyl)acetyl-CoA isomerase
MNYDTILFEVIDGVALLTLNRPEALNSLSVSLLKEIRDAFKKVAQDPAAKALVITGSGEGFCAGADLIGEMFPGADKNFSVGEMVSWAMKKWFNPLVLDIERMEKPVISAVNGVTAGGGVGFALAADIVIAARSAYFKLTFGPRLGIIPDMGSTWFLPRLIGRSRALAISFLGEQLSAEKAAEWGLIYKCVDDDALMDEVMAVAGKLAKGPTKAWDYIKRAYRESERNNLEQQLDFERYCQLILADSDDFMEGVTAFGEKREPRFKGR